MTRTTSPMATPSLLTAARWRTASVLATAAVLAGCASPPPPPSPPPPTLRVVLLPQKDATGQPVATAVQVTSGDKVQALDKAFALAELGTQGQLTQRIATVDEVQARYGDVLKIQPPSPQTFVLSFLPGSSNLTPESEQQLPRLIEQARARAGGEILVVGHTDRVGNAEANDRLSLQRAQAIANLFKARGFNPDLLSAIGRGEREPLVPTADDVAEPRNRRAEIVIR